MTITANTRAHRRYWPEVGPDVPLTSPVPARPAERFCTLCGAADWVCYDSHPFGCPGHQPTRDPADPPRRPWVDAALAYGGDAA